MAKRLTPIERAIAGEPTDRRRRHEQRQRERGIVRVSFTCTRNQAAVLKRAMEALAAIPEVSPDDPDEEFGEAMSAVDNALLQMTIAEILLPPERPERTERKRGRTARSPGTEAATDAV